MRFEGTIDRDGKFWIVEIPGLDLMTQGRSRAEAYRMAKSVVEDIVGKPGFKADLKRLSADRFSVGSNDVAELIALMLRRARAKSGLTLVEVAKRIGSKSPNAYGAYEQGKREPTLSKLEELLKAVNPENDLYLRVG